MRLYPCKNPETKTPGGGGRIRDFQIVVKAELCSENLLLALTMKTASLSLLLALKMVDSEHAHAHNQHGSRFARGWPLCEAFLSQPRRIHLWI